MGKHIFLSLFIFLGLYTSKSYFFKSQAHTEKAWDVLKWLYAWLSKKWEWWSGSVPGGREHFDMEEFELGPH